MTTGLTYTALVYNTVSGIVIREVNFSDDPEWTAQINDQGSWSVTVPLESAPSAALVREWCVPWRFSVAVFYGNFLCQAGPVVSFDVNETARTVKIGGLGLWGLFNRRVLHNNTWNPSLATIADATAGLSFKDSLYNIARSIIDESTSWTSRAGSALPIDLPAADPAGGTYQVQYNGFDLGFAGQRLQEITQAAGGPDVLFQPYITVSGGRRVIRHKMLIGTPQLTQRSQPLLFDYPSTVDSINVAGDGQNFATTAFVRGEGSEAGTLIGYSSATNFTTLGWPALDMIDSEHNDAATTAAVGAWATADAFLFNSQLEQWKVSVRTDRAPTLDVYLAGHYANYQVAGHVWIPDGQYNSRILGLSHSSGDPRDTVNHIIQVVRG